MSCSKEEIERKRLAALQKRQNLLANRNTPVKTNPAQGGSPLPSSSNSVFKSFASSLNRSHPYAKPKGPEGVQENKVPIGKVVTGTVYLISEDRFEVNPSEFCTPLINIFKSLPSKSYDSKSKLWNFSINDYQQLMSKVAPLAPHVVLGPIPPYVLKVLKEDAMDPSCVDLTPIEVTLRHKLMPFQVEGVKGRCMIADDMGLGKTFQALAIASYYRHNWPLLIVTTSSMSMYTDLLKSKKFGVVIISNLTELQIILQKRFLIRRTKEQVLTKLEEKTRETVLLDQTLLDYSQDTEKNLSEMANAYKTSKSSDKQTALITYFSESAKVKIPAVCKYIRELVSSEPASKFLVFGHHRAVIDAVCLTLDEAAVSYICIVGSTPAGARAVLNNVGLSKDTFEDNTLKHQYLSPCMTKNKNDYVPGTNIRKDSIKENENTSNDQTTVDDVDRSFLDDDEDDELLANLDL
ncbi:hypothetical protein HF086_001644 [Spodoptera exigua]|uniref:HARP domain-containing protein n=1 Tax=Spodoptera exigua TaxID=7107 RepID=A0A922SJ18_SPOEX|nr:hypothetical protein HF086_001644 [Spodoptera exigua]